MSSYNERYFYPGTATFINKLNIRDPDKLAQAEAQLSRERMRQLPDASALTAEGLKTLHHHMLQDVYDWAGQFRNVDLVKVGEAGQPDIAFSPGARVERVEIPRFYGELQYDLDAGGFDHKSPQEFAYRAAVYIADLNDIHPFPDGNGRMQRLFLDQLARCSGYRLDYQQLSRAEWIAAAKDSREQPRPARGFGPHSKMTSLIRKSIIPLD